MHQIANYRTPDDIAPTEPQESSTRVFLRLLHMLKPYHGRIILALVLLLLSMPGELFPAIVWRFVTDDIVMQSHGVHWMHTWFSLNDRIVGRFPLLISSVIWLFVVYFIGEVLGTLETWMLNRIAQSFILGYRNTVYEKLQGAESVVSAAAAHRRSHEPGDGRCG